MTRESENPVSGFLKDDGPRVAPSRVPKPPLCLSCRKDGDPMEEILCLLNRDDQDGAENFVCHAYVAKTE